MKLNISCLWTIFSGTMQLFEYHEYYWAAHFRAAGKRQLQCVNIAAQSHSRHQISWEWFISMKNEQERISAWRAAMRMDADIVVVDGVSREEEGIYSRDLGCDVVVGFSA
jgi:hypothetical protein